MKEFARHILSPDAPSGAPGRPEPDPLPQMREAVQLLREGLEGIFNAASFKEYLAVMARFHHYSAPNIALILAQRPDATQVAGYRRWQAIGRQVRKGEAGIKIFVPHLRKDPTEVDEQGRPLERLTGFGIGHVFDIAQTDGKPLPEPPTAREI